MGKKNAAPRVAPNMSSASSLSAAAATQKSNSSAILRSSFAPSYFQLSLFASVIQALDSHQLRIHDSTTGKLQCEYTASRSEITALDWGHYGSTYRIPDEQPSKKRRRKHSDINGTGRAADVVVGFGTSKSQVHIFSPTEAKILATLSEGHTNGIQDFKFVDHGSHAEAWSLGGDGKLVQWNLQDKTISRSIMSPTLSARVVYPLQSCLIVASDTAYLLDLINVGKSSKLGSSAELIQYLNVKTNSQDEIPSSYLSCSENDRYVNVTTVPGGEIIGSMVANSDINSISTSGDISGSQALAAITKDGGVELFKDPFEFDSRRGMKSSDVKSKRRSMVHKPAANVQISRPGQNKERVPIIGATFQDDDLVLAFVEGSTHLGFERMPWRDEDHDGLMIAGMKDIKKAKTLLGVEGAPTNGVKDMSRMQVDESRAVVSHGSTAERDKMAADKPQVIDISSGVEESDLDDSEVEGGPSTTHLALTNGVHNDIEMGSAADSSGEQSEDVEKVAGADRTKELEHDGEDEEEDGEPSFGDLLRANAPKSVDVAATFPKSRDKEVVLYGQGSSELPSGLSLGTVLSQALRSSDNNLLESCLHVRDLNIVRATIQRLDSTLATKLLLKLAEKLHSRPGRAGSLMVWIQWTLVSHGGYLGSQQDVVERLSSLYEVVKQRASSLQPLLSLKGKLDMLEAQMNLRRSMQQAPKGPDANSEDEEGVIYIEGQEESSDEESDESNVDKEELEAMDDTDDEREGVVEPVGMDVDEDEDSAEESAGDLIDDEASEGDEEDEDEELDDIDYEDVDSFEDESDEEEIPVPKAKSKPKLANGTGSKKK